MEVAGSGNCLDKAMRQILLSVLLVIAAFVPANSQTGKATDLTLQPMPAVVLSQALELDSKLMGRKMPYRVLVPNGYSSPNETSRYPVVYLLHGLTGNNTNWFDRTKVARYATDHKFIIVTPEGANGWYSDSVATPKDQYESYIVNELIPEIDKKFRTLADRDHRVIAGLSMGGYGSLKFGLKHPEMFSLVGSFSGAIGAAAYTEKTSGAIGKNIDGIFGPVESDTRKANDVFKIVRDLTPAKQKVLPFIYQSCGTEDFLIKNNRDFLALMNEKKITHEYREHPGAHDWKFWDEQVREFLNIAERRLKK